MRRWMVGGIVFVLAACGAGSSERGPEDDGATSSGAGPDDGDDGGPLSTSHGDDTTGADDGPSACACDEPGRQQTEPRRDACGDYEVQRTCDGCAWSEWTGEPPACACAPLSVSAVTAHANGDAAGDAVLDDDLETRWSAEGVGQWIDLSLQDPAEVSGVELGWHLGDTRRVAFRVDVSDDGEAWQTVFHGWSTGDALAPEPYGFAPVHAAHVRVTCLGSTATNWCSVTHARVLSPGCELTPDRAPTDSFGIKRLYATPSDSAEWNSQHWNDGTSRLLDSPGETDPYDPTGWSEYHGNAGSMYVNPETGYMRLRGNQPRMYIHALPSHAWRDTEFTVYYERKNDDGTAFAGGILGVRSGIAGHASDPCTATTYYSMLRHDGAFQFAKELMHPNSSKITMQDDVWGGGPLPTNEWIGLKYVTYTLDDTVVLETYRDLTGGADGGTWELLGRLVDDGGWTAEESCAFPSDYVVTTGGGVVFIRNTGVEDALYKWMTVRELPS